LEAFDFSVELTNDCLELSHLGGKKLDGISFDIEFRLHWINVLVNNCNHPGFMHHAGDFMFPDVLPEHLIFLEHGEEEEERGEIEKGLLYWVLDELGLGKNFNDHSFR
jgi:hypothetical protein